MKFNKTYKYFWGAVLVTSLISYGCVKLEEDPLTFITPDKFFKTEADANAACLGMYSSLYSNSEFWLFAPRGVQGLVLDGRMAAENLLEPRANEANNLSNTWTTIYRTIQKANTIIEGLEKSTLDPSKKNLYIGEAKAVRAFCYLKLVKNWGDIPVHTSTFDNDYGVKPFKEVYDLIFKDLNEAMYKYGIHNSGKKGRVNKAVCRMIYADAAITIAQSVRSYKSGDGAAAALKPYADHYDGKEISLFEQAKSQLDSLINYEGLRLINTSNKRWIDMFGRTSTGLDNVNDNSNTENIFATQTIPVEYKGGQSTVPPLSNFWPGTGETPALIPTYEYVASFHTEDIRRNQGFLWSVQRLGVGLDVVKYIQVPFRKYGNEPYDGLEGGMIAANNPAYADFPNSAAGEQWGGPESNDIRKLVSSNPDRWIIVRRTPEIPTPYCAKFYDASSQSANVAISVPLYRLAEAYLMYAEAEVALNGVNQDAVDHLNAIHVRAFPDVVKASQTFYTHSFTGVEDFNKHLINEYLWEFAFEMKDSNVLIRFGKFQERIAKVTYLYNPTFSPAYAGPALGVEAEFMGQYASKQRKTRGVAQYWLPYPHAGEETNPIITSLDRMKY